MHIQVVIRNAKELYEFAETTMKDPAPPRYQSDNVKVKRRIFFYDDDILRNRRDRYFKEIKGNRSIHAILSTDGGCTLSSRQLSCYCDACLECFYDSCENSEYVSDWEEQELEHEGGHHRATVTRSDVSNTIEAVKNLATKDAIVAIASADRGVDYYLLQVTSDGPEILTAEEKDDWRASYPPGAEIIRGWFLIGSAERSSPCEYKRDMEKKAVVYAATIRYICPELRVNESDAHQQIYQITEELHMDILESLHGF